MLLLIFRVAENAYAVDARNVVEVVPRIVLRSIPHAPGFLAGLFHYRDTIVPVIDMNLLMGAAPCRDRDRLSTRIILVKSPAAQRARSLLGLMAERVDDVKEMPGEPIHPAMPLAQTPYLGPIAQVDGILVQLIVVERLLPDAVRDALFGGRTEPS
jgi:chemotaxis-related protein WspB